MQLSDEIVILTGASGGIGLAITEAFDEPLVRYPDSLPWIKADLCSTEGHRNVVESSQAVKGINLTMLLVSIS